MSSSPSSEAIPKYFKITIPVKTYVRKYIESTFPQPNILSVKNFLGVVVYAFLEKEKIKNHVKKNAFYMDHRYGILNDKITVLIPSVQVLNYSQGFSMSKIKAILINGLFEKKITEDIYVWCNAYTLSGLSNRQAIEDFADAHDIFLETDITFGCFKKSQYRHKKMLKLSRPILSRDFA